MEKKVGNSGEITMENIAELTGLPIDKIKLVAQLLDLKERTNRQLSPEELNKILDQLVEYYADKL